MKDVRRIKSYVLQSKRSRTRLHHGKFMVVHARRNAPNANEDNFISDGKTMFSNGDDVLGRDIHDGEGIGTSNFRYRPEPLVLGKVARVDSRNSIGGQRKRVFSGIRYSEHVSPAVCIVDVLHSFYVAEDDHVPIHVPMTGRRDPSAARRCSGTNDAHRAQGPCTDAVHLVCDATIRRRACVLENARSIQTDNPED